MRAPERALWGILEVARHREHLGKVPFEAPRLTGLLTALPKERGERCRSEWAAAPCLWRVRKVNS